LPEPIGTVKVVSNWYPDSVSDAVSYVISCLGGAGVRGEVGVVRSQDASTATATTVDNVLRHRFIMVEWSGRSVSIALRDVDRRVRERRSSEHTVN
jgi:hypothetical protein